MKDSQPYPDTVFANTRAITLDSRYPFAEAVAVKGNRISWVGLDEDLDRFVGPGTRIVDCGGKTMVPGFIDAHAHFLAYASSLVAVDCSPSAVSSVSDIKQALRQRSRITPAGEWIRGVGYEEFFLEDGRHPDRHDLDEAAPDHPIRLNHRSGHGCVLNSAALRRVGISATTPEPPGAVIDRDWVTGEPTGRLLEMDGYLDDRVPPISHEKIVSGIRLASQRLSSVGITSIQDATSSNSVERWGLFRRLKGEETLSQRVTMMVGAAHLERFLAQGVQPRSGGDSLSVGAVKVMLTATSGVLHPSPAELRVLVLRARESGFQLAVHAVEAEAVEAALEALTDVGIQHPPPRGRRDRIEHCSECPPQVLDKLSGSGVLIVTQPPFIFYVGKRYLSEVPPDRQAWLYRIKSFLSAGLHVAGSSDAPVADPNPLVGIYAAVTRRTESGEAVGPAERVGVEEALKMYTVGGAFAAFQELHRGSIEVGKLADLVLLDGDLTRVDVELIPNIGVSLTVIGGSVVWEG